MEFSQIQEFIDPNLQQQGSFLFYSKSFSAELRLVTQTNEEKFISVDTLTLKLYGNSQDKQHLDSILIQLTSEIDVFFNYTCSFDAASFLPFAEEEQLNLTFEQFPAGLKDILGVVKESTNQKIVCLMYAGQPTGNLVILENLGHKNCILLSIPLELASREIVKGTIMYRYSQKSQKLRESQDKLLRINDYLTIKNPGLLNVIEENCHIKKQNGSGQKQIDVLVPAKPKKQLAFY